MHNIVKVLLFILIACIYLNFNDVLANINNEYRQKIAEMIYNSKCSDAIKRVYLKVDENNKLQKELKPGIIISTQGTVIQGYKLDANGNRIEAIPLTCMNAQDLEKILVRLFLGLFSVVGVVLFISAIKGVILLMTSTTDPQKRTEAYKAIYMPFVYFIGLIFSYFLLVTFLVDFIGFGVGTSRKEYSLFCKNEIIISLAFDRIPDCK